jgi:hypothetical protein
MSGEFDSRAIRRVRHASDYERKYNVELYFPTGGGDSEIISWGEDGVLYRNKTRPPREHLNPVIFYHVGPRKPLLDQQYLLDGAVITGREWLKAQGETK